MRDGRGEREGKGFRERKREFLEREALRLCVCERVKKSLVLFGEREVEREGCRET